MWSYWLASVSLLQAQKCKTWEMQHLYFSLAVYLSISSTHSSAWSFAITIGGNIFLEIVL